MILVDTSIWVDHLKTGNRRLQLLLLEGAVMTHPWVIGELALGNLRRRLEVLGLLRRLPHATVATDDELLSFINSARLHGAGVGYVDAQLLASTRLTPEAALWTRDGRLSALARRLGIGFDSEP